MPSGFWNMATANAAHATCVPVKRISGSTVPSGFRRNAFRSKLTPLLTTSSFQAFDRLTAKFDDPLTCHAGWFVTTPNGFANMSRAKAAASACVPVKRTSGVEIDTNHALTLQSVTFRITSTFQEFARLTARLPWPLTKYRPTAHPNRQ